MPLKKFSLHYQLIQHFQFRIKQTTARLLYFKFSREAFNRPLLPLNTIRLKFQNQYRISIHFLDYPNFVKSLAHKCISLIRTPPCTLQILQRQSRPFLTQESIRSISDVRFNSFQNIQFKTLSQCKIQKFFLRHIYQLINRAIFLLSKFLSVKSKSLHFKSKPLKK